MPKVLVVATSRKTRGGITSVIKAHEQGPQWKNFQCEWIETHVDGTVFQKIKYFVKGLFQFIYKLPKSDIVHIHLAAVERKMPFIFLSKLYRKKLIVHFHFPDPYTTIYNPNKEKKYGWCIEKADVVVALSNTWKQMLETRYRTNKIEVLYNPCPNIGVKPPFYEKLKGDKYILYAGNLSVRKGYRDLMTSFANVSDQLPRWSLKFAGNGEIDQAKSLAKDLGIEDRVEFLGWVSGKDKDKAFRNASVYCLPSYAEGFPMGVLDAWAYGLPVITTPVGGLPDILKDFENALVFNPGNIEELQNKLLQLNDNNLLLRLSKKSIELANETFNVNKINSALGCLYSKLLNN